MNNNITQIQGAELRADFSSSRNPLKFSMIPLWTTAQRVPALTSDDGSYGSNNMFVVCHDENPVSSRNLDQPTGSEDTLM